MSAASEIKGIAITALNAISDIVTTAIADINAVELPPRVVIVAGADSAAVNGRYTERGVNLGKPYFNLEGEPDDPARLSVAWRNDGDVGLGWHISLAPAASYYYNDLEDVALPWESALWREYLGGIPVPTVTEE